MKQLYPGTEPAELGPGEQSGTMGSKGPRISGCQGFRQKELGDVTDTRPSLRPDRAGEAVCSRKTMQLWGRAGGNILASKDAMMARHPSSHCGPYCT